MPGRAPSRRNLFRRRKSCRPGARKGALMRISRGHAGQRGSPPMIRGYANHPSVLQGERLEFKAQTKPMLAHARPLGAPDRDWNWPIYEYPIPCDWESGAYVALFVPIGNEAGSDPVISPLSEAAALFVVKRRTPNGKILYKLPLFTYHAYNEIGDPCGSFYTGGYSKLTLHRPGAGVGGRPWDHYFPDFYDASSPRPSGIGTRGSSAGSSAPASR